MNTLNKAILKRHTDQIIVYLIFYACAHNNKKIKLNPLRKIIDYLDDDKGNLIRNVLFEVGLFSATYTIVEHLVNTEMDPKAWAARYKLIGDGEEFVPILTELKDEILKLPTAQALRSAEEFNNFLLSKI